LRAFTAAALWLGGTFVVSADTGSVSPLTGRPISALEVSGDCTDEPGSRSEPRRLAPCVPGVLYGTDGGRLYTIDTTTGAATLVGSHNGLGVMGGLAFDETGALYSMSIGGASDLFSVDPGSGFAAVIGRLGIGFVFEGGLSFSGAGVLYGVDQGDAASAVAFTIDPTTGAATIVGPGPGQTRDLNGIVFDGTTLYALDRESNSLGTVDPVAGQFAPIGPTLALVGASGGLTVDPETCTLYAFLEEGPGLYTLDKTTGAATFVGPNVINFGLAFCPSDPGCTSCDVVDLISVSPLLGVKERPDGARFVWSTDPEATEYHLNAVTTKQDLLDPRLPPGNGKARCTPVPVAPLTSCVDPVALIDSQPLLFYQVLSACGSSANDEGPF